MDPYLRQARAHGKIVMDYYMAARGRPLVRELLWEVQDQKCIYCECQMVPHRRHPNHRYRDTMEHVYPQALGGVDWPGNLALACDECNNRKGDRGPSLAEAAKLEALNFRLGWTTVRVWADVRRTAEGAAACAIAGPDAGQVAQADGEDAGAAGEPGGS